MLYKGNFGDITPEQKEKLERIKKNIDLLIGAIFKMLEKKKKVESDQKLHLIRTAKIIFSGMTLSNPI